MAMRKPVEAPVAGRERVAAGSLLADGVAVEQGLGRVLVPAVAGVDHRRPVQSSAATCQGTPAAAWRTTKASTPMASMVSTVSRSDSPLLSDERRHREGHGVGREALGRGLEAEPGPGGVLEEERDDRLAPQGRHPRDGPFAHLDEAVGQPEHLLDAVGAQVGDGEQMLAGAVTRGITSPMHDAVLAHVDHLVAPGGQVLAHVVGPDRAAPGGPGRP